MLVLMFMEVFVGVLLLESVSCLFEVILFNFYVLLQVLDLLAKRVDVFVDAALFMMLVVVMVLYFFIA